MAAEVNRQNLHHGVGIALVAFRCGVGVLVVDAARPGNLIVNGLRVARPLRAVVLALHHGARPDSRRLARGVRDVVPEMLRVRKPDACGERLPVLDVLAVCQHAVARPVCWPLAGPTRGHVRSIRARRRVRLTQGARPPRTQRRRRQHQSRCGGSSHSTARGLWFAIP